jgi:hypothetical protein
MSCTLLLTIILSTIVLFGSLLLHVSHLLHVSLHLHVSLLLLAVQHPKKLLLLLPRGHSTLQVKT